MKTPTTLIQMRNVLNRGRYKGRIPELRNLLKVAIEEINSVHFAHALHNRKALKEAGVSRIH